jgi:predicted RNase H-like HicB family nuclease
LSNYIYLPSNGTEVEMIGASFDAWIHLLGGVLVIGIIGLILSVVEQRRRSNQASRVPIMVEFPAMVEQAGNGTWTAAIVAEHSVLGTGASKEEALEDLRKGVAGLVEYLKRNPKLEASK